MTTSAFVTGGSASSVARSSGDSWPTGWTVRALARSDASAGFAREHGAEPVLGDTAFRDFVTRPLATQGVTPPGRSLPAPVAAAPAAAGDTAWRAFALPGRPPPTRLAVWASAPETTIDVTRAHRARHTPLRTIEDGLEELSQS